ncbi:MAG: tetraacyldisaccharide 4'-kinase [Candidatus Pelagibacter sp.]
MRALKPKFWDEKNNFISLLLLPISLLWQLLLRINKIITFQHTFKIPVICVGNIYVGGTGKTPLTILIARELIKNKRKPAIIKKYYSQHTDEENLINEKINCLFVNTKRIKAIQNAEKENYDVAILDDGFQDFSIKKKLNILCFNSKQLIGNGMTLPSGPLREGKNSIKDVNIILINGKKDELFEKKILEISNKVKIFNSEYIPLNINSFQNKKLFAFSGIGNPENFFDILNENNLNLKKKLIFPDHYQFSKSELEKMTKESHENNLELITTEKDYYRIKHYGFKNIKYLKVDLKIENKEEFINEILNYL